MEMKRRELAPGVQLFALETSKFKTNLLGITFFDRLASETAAQNAIIPALLRRGSRAHPDMEALSAALDALYGGSIEPLIRKKGETQCIGFLGSFLDDAYVPEESNILEDAAALMGEILLQPKGDGECFDPDYLESERQNLILRIRARINDKQQYAMYRLLTQMCAGEAYGVDKLGEEAEASAMTADELWRRYRALLEKAPVLVYYCGSAPIERVEMACKKAFAPLLTGERNEWPHCDSTTVKGKTRQFEDRLDVTQGKLTMGFRLGKSCTLSKELAPAMIFNALFGGSTNSKLFLNVRERLSLCYYASSAVDKFKGMLLVSSGVAFDKCDEAREEILAQLDDCRNGNITKEELENARRYIVNFLKTGLDAQGRLEDYWLAQAVARASFDAAELIAQVEAATLEEVVQVAKDLTLDSVYFLNGKEATQ